MLAKIIAVVAMMPGWFALHGAEQAPNLTLSGIFKLNTNKTVLIEQTGGGYGICAEGERSRLSGQEFEVLRIHPDSGSVDLKINGLSNSLRMKATPAELANRNALLLKTARLTPALEVYQRLAARTVIRPPNLPEDKVDLAMSDWSTPTEITDALRVTLSRQQLRFVDYGDKFTVVVRLQQTNLLAEIPLPPVQPANEPQTSTPAEQILPAGVLRFQSAELNAVLDVYAELVHRTILRPGVLPDVKTTLSSQTACRMEEAVWMFETVLQLAGLKVEKHGDKFVYVGPPALAGRVPKFPPEAAQGAARFTARIQLANAFPRPGEPPEANPPIPSGHRQLLNMYAEISGREPVLEPPMARVLSVNFKTQTSLTAAEAIYALEAVAALHDCRFERIGNQGVRLVEHRP